MRCIVFALCVATPLAAQDAPPLASEQSAYRTSLLATVIPVTAGVAILAAQGGGGNHDRSASVVLISGGLLVGPFLGYGSAGLGGRGLRGMGIRAGLGLASVIAAIGVCGMDCSPKQDAADVATVVIIGGGALVAAAAAYDVAHVRDNVRRRDERACAKLSLAPVYVPTNHRLGVRLNLSF